MPKGRVKEGITKTCPCGKQFYVPNCFRMRICCSRACGNKYKSSYTSREWTVEDESEDHVPIVHLRRRGDGRDVAYLSGLERNLTVITETILKLAERRETKRAKYARRVSADQDNAG